ncbi:hypothetical protein EPO05_04565, partial [Patescibacteria group bacterium]
MSQRQTQNITKIFFSLIITISLFLMLPQMTGAAINKQINYQGKLTDTANVAIPNGNYDMRFYIYDALTVGNLLWTGTHTTANSNPVAVTGGIFSVLLGSGTGNTLDLDFDTDSYYLEVEIYNSGTTTWETFDPRKRIGAVPQAYNANNVNGDGIIRLTGAPTGTTIPDASVYINPASAAGGSYLLGLSVGGNNKFSVKEDGTVSATGPMLVGDSNADYLSVYGGNASGDIRSVSGALTLTPNAGSNLNINLSTTGDFAVNTDQLYVDTSLGNVGIGTGTPGQKLSVNGSFGILENDLTTSIFYTIFQGGDQGSDITYTLPIDYPDENGYVLKATTDGTLSWEYGSRWASVGSISYLLNTTD